MITKTACAKLSKRERVPSFLQSSSAKKLQQRFIMPKFFLGMSIFAAKIHQQFSCIHLQNTNVKEMKKRSISSSLVSQV
jgi:hypothetical protein